MIDNRDIEDIYELSPLQKGMLYHNLQSNEKDFYCEQTTLTLEGGISLSDIQNAFDGLIKKYVVLRTNFLYNNLRKPVQIVWVNKKNIIEYKDISELDKEQKVKYLEDFKEKDRLRGFDLSTDALIRLSILKIDSEKFKLILSHHHIIMDGWCFGIILNDLFEMYKCSILNKKINVDNTTPYSKYIKWLENLDHKESIDYWRDYLRGIEQHTQIPAQNSLSVNHDYIRSEKSIIFSEELTRNLKLLAGDLKVTLNTVLQCIWGILLQRYNGTNDVTFGSVVSGRSPEIRGIEKMVGLFINTVPVRIQTQEGTFKNLVREVQKRVLDSEKYNYTPIVDIQNCLERRQLFDHIFVFENYPLDLNIFNRQKDLGFKVSNIEVYEKSNYNFNILILPGDEFEIKIIFNGEKYEEQFIDGILNQIKFITSQIISDPNLLIGEIELISQNTITEIKNHEFPNKSVHEIFEEQVKRFPNKIAIRIEEQSLTYDELNKRANQLARFLLNNGVGQGELVGISMLRCFDLYIGMLAILKIGAAYVPVETSYPQQRLIQLVRDSKISIFITKDDLTLDTKELTIIDIDEYTEDIKEENESNLHLPIFGNELAYVMFTSGSTGKPKGILTTHQNIISRVYNSNYVEINEMDKILQLSNCTFDGSSFEIYSSLLNGGELVVVQEDKLLNISYLSELIENKGITITFITTALFNKIVDLNITCLKNLKNILFGGEKASIKHVIKAVKALGENRLIHVYGPTETTIFATYFLIDYFILNSKRVPIGQPINDTQIYILDSNLKPVPRGIQGEIYIGGRGVAQGYINSSELTDKHFIPNLFDDSKTRLYKTGDLGCFLPDGNVEFLGRIDNQVKIRGYRVEIEEIENLIMQHSYVKEAVINIVGDMNLIAYITLHKDINKNTINWKKYFLERLPHYMVPTHIIEMEKIPLTSNGKLDRKALPLPEIQSVEEYVAPTNEIEKSIEKMWREILETDQISIHANFFELGGHSLKAMMLVSRISKQFQVQVPINEIFSRPTIKELSEYVQKTDEKTYLPTIERVEHQKYYPASSVQKRLHTIHHIDETKMTYNMPMVLSIEGALDIKRLEGALQTIVSRHESLRTSFHMVDDELVQKIEENLICQLQSFDADSDTDVEKAIQSFIRAFELDVAPLCRFGLVHLTEKKYLLLIDMHHIISDGVSMGIFMRELRSLYHQIPLEPIEIQYKDYTSWQEKLKKTKFYHKQEEYWMKELTGELPVLHLPTDFPRPAIQKFDGKLYSYEFDPTLAQKLVEFSSNQGVTLFITLLAAYNALLYKYSGQEDILIGSPIVGRSNPELENVIGMFANTIVFRNYPTGGLTFREFLQSVKERSVSVYENADYLFEELVEKLEIERDLSRNPLFDTMFILQNIGQEKLSLSNLTIREKPIEWSNSKMDMSWTIVEGETIHLILEYSTHLFKEETIGRMIDHYMSILQDIVEQPDKCLRDIELVLEKDRQQLLLQFNDTKKDYVKTKTLYTQFEEQVKKSPETKAVVFEGNELTYQELNERANQLAYQLREKGVTREDFIGIMTERSVEMIVGILGVLKAGGAYLPLDPSYPSERIEYMLQDSGAKYVLTHENISVPETFSGEIVKIDDLALTENPRTNLEEINEPTDLAYLIYTSGTTGKPKGVMVEHKSVSNFCLMGETFGISSGSRVLQFASFSFDVSIGEIFPTLLSGATLYLGKKELFLSGHKFTKWLKDQAITTAFFPPSVLRVTPYEDLPDLKTIIAMGEACTSDIVKVWGKERTFINGYGPTEVTIGSTAGVCTPDMEKPSIGTPNSNERIYIVDDNLNLQPIGIPGELCIGGEGLARGYWNLPELTEEKFVRNPFIPGEKMYRTGDLARWLPDGSIDYVGRIDDQINIRGYRIEPSEIEHCLLEYQNVKEAVVVIQTDYLCAYVIVDDGYTMNDLREYLKQSLPHYMVPTYIIEMEKMPLTSNGKLDRKALPLPEIQSVEEYVAPTNEIEKSIEKMWREILETDQISIHANFFELGGHSLKAMMLVSRISKQFQVQVPINEIFSRPTIKELSEYVQKTDEKTYLPTIERVEHQKYYPASSVQKRLHTIHHIDETKMTYNMPMVLSIEGALDIKRLEGALQTIVSRHESLRTSFHMVDDELVQKIEENLICQLQSFDADSDTDVEKAIQSFIRAFELDVAPLCRFGLVHLTEKKYLLLIDMHHIISDGVSMGIFMRELRSLYHQIPLEPIEIQYKDYTSWQEKLKKTEFYHKQEEYWMKELTGELPVLHLPTDFPRPAIQKFDGKLYSYEFDPTLAQKLVEFSSNQGVTLFITLLAAYNALLYKYSGQEDILIGSPIVGRSNPELENVIGMFANTIVFRNYPTGGLTFREFLQSVKERSVSVYENADYLFEELVEKLEIERDLSRNPLFDTMFILQNIGQGKLSLSNLTIREKPIEWSNSKMDMSWTIVEGETIHLILEYSTHLFKEETIGRMIDHYMSILQDIVEQPDKCLRDIELVLEKDRQQLLLQFNDTKKDYVKTKTLYTQFEEQVKKSPETKAVVFEDNELTYQELNERANQLAYQLREKGVTREDFIGIMTERSVEMIVGILGVLKAGGAYLPLDPSYPSERIEYMLQDSGAKYVLTHENISVPETFSGEIVKIDDLALTENPRTNLEEINESTDLAYLIYTSGTTGKPKGVMVEHKSVSNFCLMGETFGISSGSRVLQFASFSFDAAVGEIFPTLLSGATLYLGKKELFLSGHKFTEWLKDQAITTAFFPPSVLRVTPYEELPDLKTIITMGEACTSDIVKVWGKGRTLINGYGPTEATIGSTAGVCTPDMEKPMIGKVFPNKKVYILNQDDQVQPIGIPGELCIGGEGLARGYWNLPELTKEKFVRNPFIPGEKMYRTGDLARWLPDGSIDYVGRIDDQINIRGYRIEPSEIEHCLLEYQNVKEAVVVIQTDYLCAYVIVDDGYTMNDLREYLKQSLPHYMVPTYIIEMEKMPLTSNGKLDRKALPLPEIQSVEEYVAPTNEIEKSIEKMWREILETDQISIHANFFELGGHSLKAMMLVSRISKQFQVQVPINEIFSRPTIKELSEYVQKTDEKTYLPTIERVEHQKYYPASSVQKRLHTIHHIDETKMTYNMPMVLSIEGALDIKRLEGALQTIVSRHESLRTSFHMVDDELVQKIEENLICQLQSFDADSDTDVEKAIQSFIRAFELDVAPLCRFGLVHLTEKKYLLLIDMHHIISDGVSMGIFMRELRSLYHQIPLEPIEIQYKDYTSWQEKLKKTEFYHKQEEYWMKELTGELPVLHLPTDFPRPAIQKFDGKLYSYEFDPTLAQKLVEFSSNQGVTLFITLLAAYNALLYKYSGQEDILIGSPIVGRSNPELENVIGMFANTIVFRNYPTGGLTFREFLQSVKERSVSVYENADYLFEELVEKLEIERDLSRNPLFDTMFILQNIGQEKLSLSNLTIREKPIEWSNSKMNMSWTIVEGETIHLILEYSTHLFKEETIGRMIDHYMSILQDIVEQPDKCLRDIELVLEKDRQQLLLQFNDTKKDYVKTKTLYTQFEEQVKKSPETKAVVFEGNELTYQELNERANQLAYQLREKGVTREDFIGIMTERSVEMIVGILGVLKAGGAYLPLDPSYPSERIEYMLQDSGAKYVLTHENISVPETFSGEIVKIDDLALTENPRTNLEEINESTDLAYLIYTSGTTGKPKGVMVEHKSVSNFCLMGETFGISSGSRVLQFASFSFDAAVGEIFPTLLSGATLYLGKKELFLSGHKFTEWLKDQTITTAFFPPSVLRVTPYEELPDLKTIITMGEACTSDIVKVWGKGRTLINGYGPTEATIGSTAGVCTPDMEKPMIGKVFPNKKVYILNQDDQVQPIGIPGELCIGGEGLARGYWNLPELTKEKFVRNPFIPGEKMYRTGDLARWLPDGSIDYVGRIDDQINIRGYRIEPSEIEHCLLEYQNVKEAVVVIQTDYLCAYVIVDDGYTMNDLREYLKQSLPHYMVPTYIIEMEKMPLTSNGKLDRKALPLPEIQSVEEYVAPTNEIEKSIEKMWREILETDQISIHANFFELGGHSLKAMMLVSRISKQFQVQVPINEIFSRPTIKELSEYVQKTDEKTYLPTIERVERKKYYPSSSHQRST